MTEPRFECANSVATCDTLCWAGIDLCDAEAAAYDKAETEGDYARDEMAR